ncbi:recombinase [Staphylococcus epidermidis]|nr:recombinase [Staphylococcus epidermidis]TBW85182.1 recombinase [Staphylococcus epidermidis]
MTYLKLLETLRKPLNVLYKVETEKVGGLFDKELQETANVVINKDEFNQFQE